MGTTSLSVCPGCNRHVRCGERACPFCGASVSSFACVLEYRIKTRLDRGRAFSLGAALAAVGVASGCEEQGFPAYGAPCNPPSCQFPGGGGTTAAGAGGSAGGVQLGGNAGTATGGLAGATALGGNSGSGGSNPESAGAGGIESDGGGSAGEGGAAGEGGSALGGAGASGAGGGNQ